TYFGGTQVYYDPFFRIRRTVPPIGSPLTLDYQGLVTTTRVQGIQGGSIASPSLVSSKTTQTTDIYGRLVETDSYNSTGASDVFLTGTILSYDALDRLTQGTTKQGEADATGV